MNLRRRLLVVCLLFGHVSFAQAQEKHSDGQRKEDQSKVVIANLKGSNEKELFFGTIFESHDAALKDGLMELQKTQVFARHRMTTFYPNIYAIVVNELGEVVFAARFNSGLFQPVKVSLREKKWIGQESGEHADHEWGKAVQMDRMLWHIAAPYITDKTFD